MPPQSRNRACDSRQQQILQHRGALFDACEDLSCATGEMLSVRSSSGVKTLDRFLVEEGGCTPRDEM
jgi:hypothetical protein